MPDKPNCLHLPKLYEESTAIPCWESVPDVTGYELDASFNENFEEAMTGLEWALLDDQERQWQDISMDWEEFENQTAKSRSWQSIAVYGFDWSDMQNREKWGEHRESPVEFRVFKGLGFPAAISKHTWADSRLAGHPWQNARNWQWSWEDWKSVDYDGLKHLGCEVDIPRHKQSSSYRVRSFDDSGTYSPYLVPAEDSHLARSLARDKPFCLHVLNLYENGYAQIIWGDLYGADSFVLERSFNGGDFSIIYEGPGENIHHDCPAMTKYVDVNRHFLFRDLIPIGTQKAVYRVKARNATDESQYLESSELAVLAQDNFTLTVTPDKEYSVQVIGKNINRLTDTAFSLLYPPDTLRLDTLTYQNNKPEYISAARPYGIEKPQEGIVRFRCDPGIPQEEMWSGLIAKLTFTAITPGTATVRLNRFSTI